jgi:hypothetical protein
MSTLHKLYMSYLRGPDHPMKGRIIRHIERAIFPESGAPLGIDDGVQLWLHPRANAERHILQTGTYQPGCIQFVRTNLKDGDTLRLREWVSAINS